MGLFLLSMISLGGWATAIIPSPPKPSILGFAPSLGHPVVERASLEWALRYGTFEYEPAQLEIDGRVERIDYLDKRTKVGLLWVGTGADPHRSLRIAASARAMGYHLSVLSPFDPRWYPKTALSKYHLIVAVDELELQALRALHPAWISELQQRVDRVVPLGATNPPRYWTGPAARGLGVTGLGHLQIELFEPRPEPSSPLPFLPSSWEQPALCGNRAPPRVSREAAIAAMEAGLRDSGIETTRSQETSEGEAALVLDLWAPRYGLALILGDLQLTDKGPDAVLRTVKRLEDRGIHVGIVGLEDRRFLPFYGQETWDFIFEQPKPWRDVLIRQANRNALEKALQRIREVSRRFGVMVLQLASRAPIDTFGTPRPCLPVPQQTSGDTFE